MLTTEPIEDEPEVIAEVSQDLDPASWLARDESDVVGRVSVRGGTLRVGALTQGEIEDLRKQSRWMNPATKQLEVRPEVLNKRIIAFALNKAYHLGGTPQEVMPDALTSKLTGDLTEIARKILRISGFVDDEERANLEDMFPDEPGAH